MTDEKLNDELQRDTDDSGFDLSAPTGELSSRRDGGERPPLESLPPSPKNTSVDPRAVREQQRQGGEWKGLEQDEEIEPEVVFEKKGVEEDEMDMTPMVDVVFLLLIFFMVTASFTMQKSIQQPPLSTDEPSTQVIDKPEDEDEYVEIIIDQYNTYRLTSRDDEEIEAASDQEMRVRLRDMVETHNAKKLIITAHGEATNEKVVTAWDAGNDNEVQEIVIRLSEEDY